MSEITSSAAVLRHTRKETHDGRCHPIVSVTQPKYDLNKMCGMEKDSYMSLLQVAVLTRWISERGGEIEREKQRESHLRNKWYRLPLDYTLPEKL